jgi:hypothetical protein
LGYLAREKRILPQKGVSQGRILLLRAIDLANGLIAWHEDTQPFDNMEEDGEKTSHKAQDKTTTN